MRAARRVQREVRRRRRAACRSRASATSRSSELGVGHAARRPQPSGTCSSSVMPGIVLISFTQHAAAAALEEEVAARVAGAVDGRERGDREAADLVGLAGRQVGRDGERHHAVGVLRLVVVELVRRTSPRRRPTPRARRCRAPPHSISRASTTASTIDLAVVGEGELERRPQLGAVVGLADADARAQVRRLDEHRLGEAGRDGGDGGVAVAAALAQPPGSRPAAGRPARRPPSSAPCPCPRRWRPRPRRRRAGRRARAGPGWCRPRRTCRAGSGRRRRAGIVSPSSVCRPGRVGSASKATGRDGEAASPSRTAAWKSSTSSQRPSGVMPTGTTR